MSDKKQKSPPHITADELRVGNQIFYFSKEEGLLYNTVDWQDIRWAEEDPVSFNQNHAPIILTEEIMRRIRCRYNKDNTRIEFSVTEPGERQIEKNYWSRELISDRRLHLSPSYDYEIIEGQRVKSNTPKFWFIWLCSYGTGGSWFLNIRDCHVNPLIYFHDLQNIYRSIGGAELLLKEIIEPQE